jgi:hypothetical protein
MTKISRALPYTMIALIAGLLPAEAWAHVKWFAPYIVEASPRPVSYTLSDTWFWTGLVLVLLFFIATRMVERAPFGITLQDRLDRLTDPLWRRQDDFIRIVIGVFFVAIFAVGGVYLTPDLKTSSEWVSWSQLLIAALVFSRRTQPLAAAGIIGLWLLALRDYQLFHMLDYLALGVGVAAYLVLEASSRHELRRHRITALRIGVAIALMWSSLEKFGYPDWFYPLVEEKPFLTFGLPRDAFIPMAGLAEFTMGFGLLWTPLIRRLSAMALFIIFTAAVYPFGRIDLIGHALIMAIIVAIIIDHARPAEMNTSLPHKLREKIAGIPLGLTMALVVFIGAYWGTHIMVYGPNNTASAEMAGRTTHTFDPAHPHGAGAIAHNPHNAAYQKAMDAMHTPMMEGIKHEDPDMAFVLGMLPHHAGATDMAEIQLQYGKDQQMRDLASRILRAQHQEMEEMRLWLEEKGYKGPPSANTPPSQHRH